MPKRSFTTLYYQLKLRYGSFLPFVMGCCSFLFVFLYGLFIYMYVEGWGFLDSFYQVVITLSTVGFTETHELSETGRMLTSSLILLGVGTFAYLVGTFTQFLVEGKIQDIWGKRKMQKVIDTLKDHFIVCGYGRIGSVVVREIKNDGLPVVVIENNPQYVEMLKNQQILVIEGDATEDEVLFAAGLTRAKGLIASLTQVAENVYITLTARQSCPGIYIVARADKESSVQKLLKAGANKALTPHMIGGMRMAQMVLRPKVTDFLELAHQGEDLLMEEIQIQEGSELIGKDLISSGIRPRFNLIIIAIGKESGAMIFNPGATEVLELGDVLVAVGKHISFEQLESIACGCNGVKDTHETLAPPVRE
ncbi:MAG: potassium channel protein [Desulfoplanes sp.]|nr:potassium channel protein [Desulfoplanes sp.]